ncbi:uncharacterized protein LOC100367684 [Saccoglossus kowalevskii]|uniref:Uncharacterized protein LOC100367684 n=1 Tax=Saccoglossus kowalevskii TaxID=10224 RepID=A0ABM0GU99_SACKO|nr:PREDICTED: uncharacterized protein LOC100367684 [Saccoglossus kowalevskii]
MSKGKKIGNNMGPIPRDPRTDNDDEIDGEIEMQMGLLGGGDDDHSDDDDDSWSEDEDLDPDPELDWLETGYHLLPQALDNPQEEEIISQNHSDAAVITTTSSASSLATSNEPTLPVHLARCLPTQKPAAFHDDAFTQFSSSAESVARRKTSMASDDQIKDAMSGISLPPTAVPQWAQFVCEEDWKYQFVSKMTDDKNNEKKD